MKRTASNHSNVTIWDEPNSTLVSQYGNVTYRNWCELEVQRMVSNGRKVQIAEQYGKIAIVKQK